MVVWQVGVVLGGIPCSLFSMGGAKNFFLFYLGLTCIMFCQLLSESFEFFELFLSFFFFLSFSFLTLAFYMFICVPFSSLSWPPRAWPKGGGPVMTHDRVTVTCHTFVTF